MWEIPNQEVGHVHFEITDEITDIEPIAVGTGGREGYSAYVVTMD